MQAMRALLGALDRGISGRGPWLAIFAAGRWKERIQAGAGIPLLCATQAGEASAQVCIWQQERVSLC